MIAFPLRFLDGHLFVELGTQLWLLDTGSPWSFGDTPVVTIDGERFDIPKGIPGRDLTELQRYVRVPCAGLLGADVLGRFDVLFDVPGGRVTFSPDEIGFPGVQIPLDQGLGVPTLEVVVRGSIHRMFFDTGAQLSYFQDPALSSFPPAGVVSDFHFDAGPFDTEVHAVDVSLGGIPFVLRCGSLPGLLGRALLMAGTTGIVGNELLAGRPAALFLRRRRIVL